MAASVMMVRPVIARDPQALMLPVVVAPGVMNDCAGDKSADDRARQKLSASMCGCGREG